MTGQYLLLGLILSAIWLLPPSRPSSLHSISPLSTFTSGRPVVKTRWIGALPRLPIEMVLCLRRDQPILRKSPNLQSPKAEGPLAPALRLEQRPPTPSLHSTFPKTSPGGVQNAPHALIFSLLVSPKPPPFQSKRGVGWWTALHIAGWPGGPPGTGESGLVTRCQQCLPVSWPGPGVSGPQA